MYKKLISSILVFALLNLLGCYSSELVNVTEYKQIEEEDKPDNIRVITKDFQEYYFSESNFYVENDTLYGKEILYLSKEELPFEGRIAFEEIESIKLKVGTGHNYYFINIATVSQYQDIEAERGKPDEVFLTKYDSTKYHFMKDNYFIENDTLYGKGKLLLGGEELLNRKIALSNIESIQFEYFNGATTALLVLGIVAVPFIVAGMIAFISLSGLKW